MKCNLYNPKACVISSIMSQRLRSLYDWKVQGRFSAALGGWFSMANAFHVTYLIAIEFLYLIVVLASDSWFV